MDTKAAFEKWCSEKGYSTEQFHYGNWAGKYKLESVRNKWEGWKESREAIEIELPESFENEWDGSSVISESEMCAKIKSLGMRIK
ncbi:hypothetical protein A9993_07715 [Rahnella victoriana]|uniref:hypothetical protein n=1 Tax=Rahnella victoriana TaxID=1510570 RepID=UPI000BB192EE|nr:hypothetical protein [Rahnella victoriana]PBI79631.1 hypothetical protein A9993_07715 [Rahnella victoriana]